VSLVLGWLWVCAGDQHCFSGSNQLFDVPEEGVVHGALQLAVAGKLSRIQELNERSGVHQACRAVGFGPKNNGTGLGCDGYLALPGLYSDVVFSQEVHPQNQVHTDKVWQHMKTLREWKPLELARQRCMCALGCRWWRRRLVELVGRGFGGTERLGVGQIRR
jgi:hypothetical protein